MRVKIFLNICLWETILGFIIKFILKIFSEIFMLFETNFQIVQDITSESNLKISKVFEEWCFTKDHADKLNVTISCFDLSIDKKIFVIVDQSSNLSIYNAVDLKIIQYIHGPIGVKSLCVKISPNSQFLFQCLSGGKIKGFDIATGINFKTIICSGGGDIYSITMNDSSRYLAICMGIGVIYMFDIKIGEYLKTKFHIRHDQGTNFIFLNDHFALVYGGDHSLRAMDLTNNRRRAMFNAHTDFVTHVIKFEGLIMNAYFWQQILSKITNKIF